MVRGTSGALHEVDLVLTSNQMKILVDIELDRLGVCAIPVIALQAKKFDIPGSKAVMVTVPKAGFLAWSLSKSYGILLIESKSAQETADQFRQNFLQTGLPTIISDTLKTSSLTTKKTNLVRFRGRFLKGVIEIFILNSLDPPGLTGYRIMARIQSNFRIQVSPGTIYPILKRLEQEHLITSSDDGKKKTYVQTDLGRNAYIIINDEFQEAVRIVQRYLATPRNTAMLDNHPKVMAKASSQLCPNGW